MLPERDIDPPTTLSRLFDPSEEIAKKARPHWGAALLIGHLVILVFFGRFGAFAARASSGPGAGRR